MNRTVAIAVLSGGLFMNLTAARPEATRKPAKALVDFSLAVEELARSSSPAVVQITVRMRAPLDADQGPRPGILTQQQATGSGVIVDPAGYIVTNAHVVDRARSIDVSVLEQASEGVTEGHKHFSAKTVGVDRETDLAVLRIDAVNLPTLPFLDSDTVKQGQVVIALGSPLGLENSLTVGFVSAPVRHLRPESPMFYIQTDAPINPGNSGGPLLDIEGRIAGINTMILSQSGGSEGIGLAIPANVVRQVYRQLRAEGRVRRGAIGVIPENVTPVLAAALKLEHHSGVILSDIGPHTAAEAAGLQTGDVILAVDGKPLQETRQLTTAIFQHSIGDQLTLDIQRGKERMQKVVTVMERPSSPTELAELANRDENLVRQLGIMALTVDEKVTPILKDLRRLSGVAVAAIPAEFGGFNPGLIAGDVIYEVNGNPIGSLDELRTALAGKSAGAPLALLVERRGQLIYVSFELE